MKQNRYILNFAVILYVILDSITSICYSGMCNLSHKAAFVPTTSVASQLVYSQNSAIACEVPVYTDVLAMFGGNFTVVGGKTTSDALRIQ